MTAASSDSDSVSRSSDTGSAWSPISEAIWSSAPISRFHTCASSPAASRSPASASAFRRPCRRPAASVSSRKLKMAASWLRRSFARLSRPFRAFSGAAKRARTGSSASSSASLPRFKGLSSA